MAVESIDSNLLVPQSSIELGPSFERFDDTFDPETPYYLGNRGRAAGI